MLLRHMLLRHMLLRHSFVFFQRASRYLRSSAMSGSSSRYGSVSTAEDDGYFNHYDEEDVFVSHRVSLTPSTRLTPSHFSHSRISPMALPVKESHSQFLSQPLSRNNSKTNRLQKKIKTCSLLSVDHLN